MLLMLVGAVIGSVLSTGIALHYYLRQRKDAQESEVRLARWWQARIEQSLMADANDAQVPPENPFSEGSTARRKREPIVAEQSRQAELFHLYESARALEQNTMSMESILLRWAELDPNDPELLARIAETIWSSPFPFRVISDHEAHDYQKRRQQLISRLYDSAVARSAPDETTALLRRGTYRLFQGTASGAAEDFAEAVKRNPKDTKSRYMLGSLLHRMGMHAKAAEHLDRFILDEPANWKGHLLLSRILDATGDSKRAQVKSAISRLLDESWKIKRAKFGGILTGVCAIVLVIAIVVGQIWPSLIGWTWLGFLLFYTIGGFGWALAALGISSSSSHLYLDTPDAYKRYSFPLTPEWLEPVLPGASYFEPEQAVTYVCNLPVEEQKAEPDDRLHQLAERLISREVGS